MQVKEEFCIRDIIRYHQWHRKNGLGRFSAQLVYNLRSVTFNSVFDFQSMLKNGLKRWEKLCSTMFL